MAVQVPSSRTIELTILSGENLRLDRKPINKNALVIIRDDFNNLMRTTTIDKEGGSNPKWNNEKLVIDLPMQAKHIRIEVVQCKTKSSGNREIGTAIIPVSDFIGGYLPDGYLHFLSYRLRDYRGERNGIINISVRDKLPLARSVCSNNNTCSNSKTLTGFPMGVVTGVPVGWYSN